MRGVPWRLFARIFLASQTLFTIGGRGQILQGREAMNLALNRKQLAMDSLNLVCETKMINLQDEGIPLGLPPPKYEQTALRARFLGGFSSRCHVAQMNEHSDRRADPIWLPQQ